MEQLVTSVTYFLQQYIPRELVVFVLSMLPISELRGGIIASALLGIPWRKAALICVVGNMIPVPLILLFIRKILSLLKLWKPTKKIAVHYEEKALKKGAEMMEKHARRIQIGIYLFVAIPLPMTGAWTGSLIAAFMGIPLRKSVPPILGGIFTAMCIMLALAYLVPSYLPAINMG